MKVINPQHFGSILSSLIIAGAALFTPGGPNQAIAGNFPGGPGNESTRSMGVMRLEITDPNMQALLDTGTFTYPYPGWVTTSHELTSPILIDFDTRIGVSSGHTRPATFPVLVGVADGAHVPPLTQDSMSGYAYSYPPAGTPGLGGSWLPGGMQEMLTEIQAFTFVINGGCNSNNNPLLAPSSSFTSGYKLVQAGFDNGVTPRSIGMVQTLPSPPLGSDFPARSFFNIFVKVKLPAVANTASIAAFPVIGLEQYAELYNDSPLMVENPNLPNTPPFLPPSVVYTHDPATLAVPLKFKHDGPIKVPGNGIDRYYYQDQTFGTIVLAGHGTLDPCAKGPNINNFVQTVLGSSGVSQPEAPSGYPFPVNQYIPWTTCTYDSLKGTNFAGQSLDVIYYTNETVYARDLSIGNFAAPIAFPALNSSVIYTNPSAVFTMQMSFDNATFFPAAATGAVRILINNTSAPDGNLQSYATRILTIDASGSTTAFGVFKLRQSPTVASPGKHLVQSGNRGYTMGGYFDVATQFSVDGGVNWNPTRSIHVKLENPPCGAALEQLHVFRTNSDVIITWANSAYKLQGTASIVPHPVWTDIPGTSPVTLSADPGNDIAYNSGSLGSAGDGTHGPGVVHNVPGALAGDTDTGAGYNDVGGAKHTVVPYQAALNPPSGSPFTAEFWAKPDVNVNDTLGPCPLFNRVSAGNRSGWVFYQRSPGTGWNFAMYNGSGSARGIDLVGGSNGQGTWSHVVAVWDGAMASLYVNGALVAGPTAPTIGYNASTAAIFSVGSYDDGVQNPFNGSVDEVCVYPTALTGTQILAHYQNGTSPAPATPYGTLIRSHNPVEYLRLDEAAPPNRFFQLVCP